MSSHVLKNVEKNITDLKKYLWSFTATSGTNMIFVYFKDTTFMQNAINQVVGFLAQTVLKILI